MNWGSLPRKFHIQSSAVYLVRIGRAVSFASRETRSNTGVGKELAQILYAKNAKVYIAARSEEKARETIKEIKKRSTKLASVARFLANENRLHVLFNNAGVMNPEQGSKIVQATSSNLESTIPKGGVPMGNLDYHADKSSLYKYNVSKAGNYLHTVEYAKRHKPDGVVSIPLNPGNLDSDLTRTMAAVPRFFAKYLLLNPPIYGANTELFAGLSSQIALEKTSAWVVPWGRFIEIRADLLAATKSKTEGGSGVGQKFWEWTEDQVKSFL
ncbi:related to Oxidoreductase, short-chain dehydrogenase [Phialocephala subalpina]|uniref:Related to Oxidoreductase, short-chain dehydrogenase n=1 Tax=Phialocephala subalpina TaxID=576137 RepID=A0A1L7XWM6_9HELO|nr:related to Oxidoreductase, short-chain dehydrogenase [Phialocephala subalpina]